MDSLVEEKMETCDNRFCDSRPLVEYLDIGKNDIVVTHIIECEVLCTLRGRVCMSFDNVDGLEMIKGNMVLLPQNCRLRLNAFSDTKLLVLRMRCGMVFSNLSLFKEGMDDIPQPERRLSALNIHREIDDFLNNLVERIDDGIGDDYYYDLKLREFLFLLKSYYKQSELHDFFYPVMSSNSTFVDFVKNNHSNVRTVIEFAGLANYSLSGFEKRFRRIFGVSPYRWMKEQKALRIHAELLDTDKPFSQMKSEYGFSSLSHFSDFCKKNFGDSPGRIRRRNAHKAL